MWLIIYTVYIENYNQKLIYYYLKKNMNKYIVSGNEDNIYFMSTFTETISCYLKKKASLYIYTHTHNQFLVDILFHS